MVLTAYEQLKSTFEKFKKPVGDKKSPAKTCRDLAIAHPELPSGIDYKQMIVASLSSLFIDSSLYFH